MFLALRVPDTFTASLICMAVESDDEISFTFIEVLPDIVKVSSDTAVVILLPPAIFNVSPSESIHITVGKFSTFTLVIFEGRKSLMEKN